MACLPLQTPLWDVTVTGPCTFRLRTGQVVCGCIYWNVSLGDPEVPDWCLGSFPSHLSSLRAGGNLPSPEVFCPPVRRSVSWANNWPLSPGRGCSCSHGKSAWTLLAGSWAAFLLPQCNFLEILFKSYISEVTLSSGRSRPPGPSLVIAILQGLALLLDGPSCHKAPGGWHGGFPAEPEQDC